MRAMFSLEIVLAGVVFLIIHTGFLVGLQRSHLVAEDEIVSDATRWKRALFASGVVAPAVVFTLILVNFSEFSEGSAWSILVGVAAPLAWIATTLVFTIAYRVHPYKALRGAAIASGVPALVVRISKGMFYLIGGAFLANPLEVGLVVLGVVLMAGILVARSALQKKRFAAIED
ncbi:MAG: hypothetical protein KC561_01045 [Myxococcales bacterium]|nr:hypothetical protein [Myxococcales bacterium]